MAYTKLHLVTMLCGWFIVLLIRLFYYKHADISSSLSNSLEAVQSFALKLASKFRPFLFLPFHINSPIPSLSFRLAVLNSSPFSNFITASCIFPPLFCSIPLLLPIHFVLTTLVTLVIFLSILFSFHYFLLELSPISN